MNNQADQNQQQQQMQQQQQNLMNNLSMFMPAMQQMQQQQQSGQQFDSFINNQNGQTVEGNPPNVSEQLYAEHLKKLNEKFVDTKEEIIQLPKDPDLFKNHQLPLARVKKIMKSDEDVRMISAEAPVLFAKACEMFIIELTHRAWLFTEEGKRRTLQKNDIAACIYNTEIFDFLIDIIPKEEFKLQNQQGTQQPKQVQEQQNFMNSLGINQGLGNFNVQQMAFSQQFMNEMQKQQQNYNNQQKGGNNNNNPMPDYQQFQQMYNNANQQNQQQMQQQQQNQQKE